MKVNIDIYLSYFYNKRSSFMLNEVGTIGVYVLQLYYNLYLYWFCVWTIYKFELKIVKITNIYIHLPTFFPEIAKVVLIKYKNNGGICSRYKT